MAVVAGAASNAVAANGLIVVKGGVCHINGTTVIKSRPSANRPSASLAVLTRERARSGGATGATVAARGHVIAQDAIGQHQAAQIANGATEARAGAGTVAAVTAFYFAVAAIPTVAAVPAGGAVELKGATPQGAGPKIIDGSALAWHAIACLSAVPAKVRPIWPCRPG